MKTISIRFFCVAVFATIAALLFFTIAEPASAQTKYTWGDSPTDDVELDGYAWSSTIGWISMNCNTGSAIGGSVCGAGGSNYGVTIHAGGPDGGLITGYAWSSNIGWIKFSKNGTGCPAGANCNARIVTTPDDTLEMMGWARACSATDDGNPNTANGDCSSTDIDPQAGGWDGWISLSCRNMGDCIGVGYKPVFDSASIDENGTHYAWGGPLVIGWVDLSGLDFSAPFIPSTQCEGDDSVTRNAWGIETDRDIDGCVVALPACSDGIDNDGDIVYDHASVNLINSDPGCSDPNDDDESDDPIDPTVTTFEPDGPSVVRTGDTVDVIIDVTGLLPGDQCLIVTIEGNGGPFFADAAGDISTTWTSSPLSGATTFTLNCNGTDVDSFDIQVIPISTEI